MADVVEINDLDALQHYRLAWNALLPGTPRASFFHTYDWLVTQWKHCAGPDRRYRILIVRAAGEVIGILPLCVQREPYHVARVRVLTYPMADWGAWYGPIGPNQAATMRVAARHLAETPRDWDLLELRWVDADPVDRTASAAALRAAGLPARLSPYEFTSVVGLSATWAEYLAGRDRRWRHEVRRQLRVVEGLGDVEFVRHRPASAACGDGQPRWDLFDECRQVAAASWQGRSTTGNTMTHDSVRDFLADCHESAARLGMVDMAVLRVNGRPAAFAYNYHYDGVVTGLRTGYDRTVSVRGLGRALVANVIRDSCDRGDRAIDLGVGDYDFKRRFRTHVEYNSRVTHYPPLALRSQGVRLTRWLKSQWGDETVGKKPNSPAAGIATK
ncbi:MAG: GNAT family N-acetyltransferase [Planctomycetales bacterium]|nr:GNAT family N-acetyltransferase [Planctomycetales bacterium]